MTSTPQAKLNALRERVARSIEPSTPVAGGPVHVVYGGAHLYRADLPQKLGTIARNAMRTWGEDGAIFGAIVGARNTADAERVAERVRAKLDRFAVESIAIDFEDGYGPRPDDEEDADAARTAEELARAATAATATNDGAPSNPDDARAHVTKVGIRIKSFDRTFDRAVRTLDRFLTTFAEKAKSDLPRDFTVTLPKVTTTAQVAALAELLTELERACGFSRRIGVELMIESPRALLDPSGVVPLRALAAAGDGRTVAVHLGAYDLTASLGVTANEQRLDHPACDAARLAMQLAFADTDVSVYDGATTLLPVARHKPPQGARLSAEHESDNARDVHEAWKLHARNVRRALGVGIHRGWDLHPAQLPARYGALYAFFLGERPAMTERLRTFVERATKATRSGQVFDDAATGQGLLQFFLRGRACGALDDEDLRATGLLPEELAARSFADIVAARAGHDRPAPEGSSVV